MAPDEAGARAPTSGKGAKSGGLIRRNSLGRRGRRSWEREAAAGMQNNKHDAALGAFMAVLDAVKASARLKHFVHETPLKTKLKGKEKAISMGFGLHVGWAVEGAIGSKHKIDASYLSPHVNIAARLQAATKQFGVSMLLSGEFVDGLSSQLKRLCRPLDRVALKGSKEPMMLFSFEPRMDERKRYFDRFELGVEAYLNGEWEQARALLEGCVNSDPGDRPPAVLLEYMEERDFVAPPTWSGHRELTSK